MRRNTEKRLYSVCHAGLEEFISHGDAGASRKIPAWSSSRIPIRDGMMLRAGRGLFTWPSLFRFNNKRRWQKADFQLD